MRRRCHRDKVDHSGTPPRPSLGTAMARGAAAPRARCSAWPRAAAAQAEQALTTGAAARRKYRDYAPVAWKVRAFPAACTPRSVGTTGRHLPALHVPVRLSPAPDVTVRQEVLSSEVLLVHAAGSDPAGGQHIAAKWQVREAGRLLACLARCEAQGADPLRIVYLNGLFSIGRCRPPTKSAVSASLTAGWTSAEPSPGMGFRARREVRSAPRHTVFCM